MEVTLPSTPQPYVIASYELVQCRPKAFKFRSVKSAIRREIIRQQQEKERKEKIAKKREEIERLMAESPGLEITEEAFLGHYVTCSLIFLIVYYSNLVSLK